jgi:hypothetical protein
VEGEARRQLMGTTSTPNFKDTFNLGSVEVADNIPNGFKNSWAFNEKKKAEIESCEVTQTSD